MRKAISFILLALFAGLQTVEAKLEVPSLFSDRMVLQREGSAKIWGWSDPGATVTATFLDRTETATAGEDGRWELAFNDLEATQEGAQLKVVAGEEEILIEDVVVGEVWIAAGQSNMQRSMSYDPDVEEHQKAPADPLMRTMNLKPVSSREPLDQSVGAWRATDSKGVTGWSATAFYFARELRRELGVPVGVIRGAWGGQAIQSFISEEDLRSFPEAKPLFEMEAKLVAEWDEEAAWEAYRKAKAKWDKKFAETGERRGRPGEPQHPLDRPQSLANIYNGVVAPVVGYGARGVIWYQGESNALAPTAPDYAKYLKLLSDSWRREWGSQLSFYIVQLANYDINKIFPVHGPDSPQHWVVVQDQQRKALDLIEDSGIAIINDNQVDPHDVHPQSKKTAGVRLSRWALAKDYGKAVAPISGPLFRSAKVEGETFVVAFDHADGLKTSDGKAVMSFELKTAEGAWVPAAASIEGETVMVRADAVDRPVHVRYAWRPNPMEANLVNEAGLPASCFTTDETYPDLRSMRGKAELAVSESREAQAQAKWPGQVKDFHGFALHEFEVNDLACKVVEPKEVAEGRPWVWRARFWGHQPQLDIALLERGYHVAYADTSDLFGSPKAVQRWTEFYQYLVEEHDFNRRAAIEAMSRGGLVAINWASKHPEKVACIYLDNPVCDIKSWPGGKGAGIGHEKSWEKCLEAHGLTEETVNDFRGNPLDHLEPLAEHQVPILFVVGEQDHVAPVAENADLVMEILEGRGVPFEAIRKKEAKHHPHSLEDPTPIVEFMVKHQAETPSDRSEGKPQADAGRPDRPNIVVILADDLGYGDLECYGNALIKTPNLNQLAKEGVRFTDAYSPSPVCSPSRVGMLTGRIPNRAGVYHHIPSSSQVYMSKDEVTIPALLKAAGYATCLSGKWHCNSKFNTDQQPQPNDFGFDHWFATQNNALPSHENPRNFVRNGESVGGTEGFSCQLVVSEALDWLKGHREQEPHQPFFMYVAFHEPHTPIESPKDLVERYMEAAKGDPEVAQYYANVANLDRAVGRLLGGLKDHGVDENTLVVFSSDNGPESNFNGKSRRSYGTPGPLRGMKRWTTEAGVRVCGIAKWPGVIQAQRVSDEPISSLDFLPTFCEVADVEVPGDLKLDGVNILPVLEGEAFQREKPLLWAFYGSANRRQVAMRDGEWKMIAWVDVPRYLHTVDESNQEQVKGAELSDFVLYDLSMDIAEEADLAEEQPEVFEAMRRKLVASYQDLLDDSPVW